MPIILAYIFRYRSVRMLRILPLITHARAVQLECISPVKLGMTGVLGGRLYCYPPASIDGASSARRSASWRSRFIIAFCSFSKARTSIWRTRSRLML